MVKIGDRYQEKMIPFKGKYHSWEYEVVGFHSEPYGDFADCERIYPHGKREKVGISIDLLKDGTFYKKKEKNNEIESIFNTLSPSEKIGLLTTLYFKMTDYEKDRFLKATEN